jgi:hypothetical protein
MGVYSDDEVLVFGGNSEDRTATEANGGGHGVVDDVFLQGVKLTLEDLPLRVD